MESEYRRGYVYIQNHFAGIIAETEEGYIFSYDKEYLSREDAVAVSLTLPLRDEPYEMPVLWENDNRKCVHKRKGMVLA